MILQLIQDHTERSQAKLGGVECMSELIKQPLTNPSQVQYSNAGVISMEGGESMPGSTSSNPSSGPERNESLPDDVEEASAADSGAGVPPGGEPPSSSAGAQSEDQKENGEEDISGPKPPSVEDLNLNNLSANSPIRELLEAYVRQSQKGLLDLSKTRIDQYIQSLNERMPELSLEEKGVATQFVGRLEDYILTISRAEIENENKSNEVNREDRRKEIMRRWSREAMGQGGVSLARLLTDRSYRNDVFNNLFASVEATPHQQFQQAFNPLTYGRYYETFMDVMREGSTRLEKTIEEYNIEGYLELRMVAGEDPLISDAKKMLLNSDSKEMSKLQGNLKDDFRRYQLERQARETLHDVNTLIYLPSIQMKGLAESAYMQQFSTQLADFAQKTPGVKEMMDIYEAQLRESMRQHDGFLPTEEVIGKVTRGVRGNPIDVGLSHIEVETKRIFRGKIGKGLVTIRILDDGVLKPEPIAAELPDWEIDRTFSIARGMMLVNLRLVSIAAESKLVGHGGRYASVFLQDVLQSYSPYRHLIAKYGVVEEAIAALMHTPQGEKGNWFVDFFKSRHPEELKKILEKFEGEEDKTPEEKQKAFDNLLYAGDVMRYVMKQNPNRAGDLYTFFTWRGGSDGEHVNPASITEEFIQEGSERMRKRLSLVGISLENLSTEQKEKVFEYRNWVGTALRLEMLRGNVESDINKATGREKYSKYIEDEKAERQLEERLKAGEITKEEKKKLSKKIGIKNREESWKIIEQMVRFQPHRLFEISEGIRERVLRSLTEGQKSQVPGILEYISDIETAILRDREKILDTADGKTFKDINLSDEYFVKEYINNTDLVKPEDRNAVNDFIKAVKTDFEDKHEEYWKEFIYQREYTHGFVLWTGDCPVDEFNMQALGQTGAIARRARDNNAQGEAVNKEIALLKNLKNIRTPDEVIPALHEIYELIQGYDSAKAKQAIAEKVEGIIKYYSGDWISRLPIIGILRDQFGVSSFAQIMHGKEAPVWKANEIRYLLKQLKNKKIINDAQFDILADKTLSTKKDVIIDTVNFAGTFLSIAMLWYMINKISKEDR